MSLKTSHSFLVYLKLRNTISRWFVANSRSVQQFVVRKSLSIITLFITY